MTGFAFGGREHGGSEECPRLIIQFSREPCGGFEPWISVLAARLSLLARAVVAGVRQAWHVEFDRVATFVASGGKETTNYAG